MIEKSCVFVSAISDNLPTRGHVIDFLANLVLNSRPNTFQKSIQNASKINQIQIKNVIQFWSPTMWFPKLWFSVQWTRSTVQNLWLRSHNLWSPPNLWSQKPVPFKILLFTFLCRQGVLFNFAFSRIRRTCCPYSANKSLPGSWHVSPEFKKITLVLTCCPVCPESRKNREFQFYVILLILYDLSLEIDGVMARGSQN